MCWAIPCRVLKVSKDRGIVSVSGLKKEVSFSLLKNVKKGDYVLIHTGFAIQKVDKKNAEFTIKFFKNKL